MQLRHESEPLRDLAERLVNATWPFLPGTDVRTRLYPAALPPGFSIELPLPPGSRLIGSAVRQQPDSPAGRPRGEGIDIVLEALGTAAEIVGWFDSTLTEQGWNAPPERAPLLPGFQQAPLPSNRVYCQSESGPWIAIVVPDAVGQPLEREMREVRIYLDTSGSGPCTPSRGSLPGRPQIADLLPRLTAPTGAVLSPVGGGGNENHWNSEALARTSTDAATLEAEIAHQLETAGWLRLDDSAGGDLAWSRWRVPATDDEFRGFLMVVEGPRRELYWLHLHIISARAEPRRGAPGGWMETSGWT
jgi:hypothetical protein